MSGDQEKEKVIMDTKKTLDEGYENSAAYLKKLNDRMDVNFNYLLHNLDVIHGCLCPDKAGTWQMRVEQSVKAAKKIQSET